MKEGQGKRPKPYTRHARRWSPFCVTLALLLWVLLLLTAVTAPGVLAQEPNPTPPLIHLTPVATVTAAPPATLEPTATAWGSVFPDAYEPNDTPETAAEVGWGTLQATLHEGDLDYYRLYLKAEQHVSVRVRPRDGLDSWLQVWRGEWLVAENDDQSATDLGSAVLFRADVEGWYLLRVARAAPGVGAYELILSLAAPTATATPLPSATPTATMSPTPSPTPTLPPTVTPPFLGVAAAPGQPAPPAGPPLVVGGVVPLVPTLTPTPTVTTTTAVSVPFSLSRLGPAQPLAGPQVTSARVQVYYDANNNRRPDPGEGIPDVSVLAVDSQGQQLVRSFTNLQGEALFSLSDAPIDRVVTPFVSFWSVRVRPGMVNEEISLGLPAVRLPVFLPVRE